MQRPLISIVTPTYKETSLKPLSIALEKQSYKNFEWIIINAGETRLKIESKKITYKIFKSQKGRGVQLNKGASLANGNILWFLHADSLPQSTALESICKNIQTGIPAGAFSLQFDSKQLYFRTISKLATWRSKLTKIPFGDQGIFIKKSTFYKIGTFPNFPLMEDIALMKNIKNHKYKTIILTETITTSARRYLKKGPIKTSLLNNLYQILYKLGYSPEKIARYYYG